MTGKVSLLLSVILFALTNARAQNSSVPSAAVRHTHHPTDQPYVEEEEKDIHIKVEEYEKDVESDESFKNKRSSAERLQRSNNVSTMSAIADIKEEVLGVERTLGAKDSITAKYRRGFDSHTGHKTYRQSRPDESVQGESAHEKGHDPSSIGDEAVSQWHGNGMGDSHLDIRPQRQISGYEKFPLALNQPIADSSLSAEDRFDRANWSSEKKADELQNLISQNKLNAKKRSGHPLDFNPHTVLGQDDDHSDSHEFLYDLRDSELFKMASSNQDFNDKDYMENLASEILKESESASLQGSRHSGAKKDSQQAKHNRYNLRHFSDVPNISLERDASHHYPSNLARARLSAPSSQDLSHTNALNNTDNTPTDEEANFGKEMDNSGTSSDGKNLQPISAKRKVAISAKVLKPNISQGEELFDKNTEVLENKSFDNSGDKTSWSSHLLSDEMMEHEGSEMLFDGNNLDGLPLPPDIKLRMPQRESVSNNSLGSVKHYSENTEDKPNPISFPKPSLEESEAIDGGKRDIRSRDAGDTSNSQLDLQQSLSDDDADPQRSEPSPFHTTKKRNPANQPPTFNDDLEEVGNSEDPSSIMGRVKRGVPLRRREVAYAFEDESLVQRRHHRDAPVEKSRVSFSSGFVRPLQRSVRVVTFPNGAKKKKKRHGNPGDASQNRLLKRFSFPAQKDNKRNSKSIKQKSRGNAKMLPFRGELEKASKYVMRIPFEEGVDPIFGIEADYTHALFQGPSARGFELLTNNAVKMRKNHANGSLSGEEGGGIRNGSGAGSKPSKYPPRISAAEPIEEDHKVISVINRDNSSEVKSHITTILEEDDEKEVNRKLASGKQPLASSMEDVPPYLSQERPPALGQQPYSDQTYPYPVQQIPYQENKVYPDYFDLDDDYDIMQQPVRRNDPYAHQYDDHDMREGSNERIRMRQVPRMPYFPPLKSHNYRLTKSLKSSNPVRKASYAGKSRSPVDIESQDLFVRNSDLTSNSNPGVLKKNAIQPTSSADIDSDLQQFRDKVDTIFNLIKTK